MNPQNDIGLTRNFNRFSLFWVLFASALTFACGPKSQSIPDASSTSSSSSSLSDSISECNQFSSNVGRMSGKMRTTNSDSEMKIRFLTIASDFDSTANYRLRFFRWKSTTAPNATPELDSNALEIRLQNGTSTVASGLRELSRDTLATFKTSLGVSTSEQVLAKLDVYVLGVDYSWQAIKTVMYNGTVIAAQTDSLLPTFFSDPNRYAQSHSGVLNQIHPFWSQRTLGWSDTQYLAQSTAWCF